LNFFRRHPAEAIAALCLSAWDHVGLSRRRSKTLLWKRSMLHDLKMLKDASTPRIQIIEITQTAYRRGTLTLTVSTQCTGDRRFWGAGEIRCTGVFDYCLCPPDSNTMCGGPNIGWYDDHPLLWEVAQPFWGLEISSLERRSKWVSPGRERLMDALRDYHSRATGNELPFLLEKQFGVSNPMYGLSANGPKGLIVRYVGILEHHGFNPKTTEFAPHGQWIPGGDGAVYNPPLKLCLLVLDQSRVVAERFEIMEVAPPDRPMLHRDLP
jgi:hypothetical protein